MRQAIAGMLVAVCLGTSAAHAGGPAPGTAAPVLSYDTERCCLLIDGQPFFALGCYDVAPEYLPECAAAGLNLAAHTGSGSDPSRALKEAAEAGPAAARNLLTAYPNAAHRAGMWTLESPLSYCASYIQGQWSAQGSPQFEARFTDFVRDPLPLVMDTLRGHPAVLGLMGFDEPPPSWKDTLEAFRKAVRDRDPSRSVVVNFSSVVPDSPNSLEIATSDLYPVRGRTPLIRIYETTRANVETARRMGRPYWFVPLMESFEQGPVLRPEDQVAQTYLAVVGGATGMLWWTWPPRHADSWVALKRLAGELRRLAPVLTERTKQPEVLVTTPDLRRTVQVRVIRHGQVTFVIAVNSVPSPVSAEFRLPQDLSGKANVWFEDRAVKLSKGRWSDQFAGLERHVYALQTGWPGEAPLQLSLALVSPPAGGAVAPPVTLPGNLLAGSGLEAGSTWLERVFPTDEPGNAGRRCFLDTAVRHWGNRSAAITFTDAGKAAAWDTQTVRLEPNTLYRYGAWARMESAGTHHAAAIVPVNATGGFAESAEIQNYAGWQEYSNLVWSGAAGQEMWLRCCYGGENMFGSESSKGSGTVWFDDAFVVPAPAGVRNMVLNGGFEGGEWLPGWPAGWFPGWGPLDRPGCVGGAQSRWGLDRAVASEGKASLRLIWVAQTADAVCYLRGISLDAGKTYTLSAYMKADRPWLGVVMVAGGPASPAVLSVPVSDDWKRYSLNYAPAEAVRGQASIMFRITSPGTLWLDGVQFEEGATPTEFRVWSD